jgi:hypothetical protein
VSRDALSFLASSPDALLSNYVADVKRQCAGSIGDFSPMLPLLHSMRCARCARVRRFPCYCSVVHFSVLPRAFWALHLYFEIIPFVSSIAEIESDSQVELQLTFQCFSLPHLSVVLYLMTLCSWSANTSTSESLQARGITQKSSQILTTGEG